MFNWLKNAWGKTKRVLGKVKSGVESGVKIFNKGKDIYGTVKNFVSNLPVVGSVAKELIGKGEESANKYAKEKTGISFEDVNKGVGMADRVSKYLPSG
jgi:hypothetical protein